MPRAEAGTDTAARLNDEAALVERLAAYDPASWQSLFETYFDRVFGLAYVRTHDRTAAEDIAAEVFAEAARGIGRYRYRGVPFRAWLYQIARNIIADHFKARSRRPQVPLDRAVAGLASPAEAVETRLDFFQALVELTPEQREVLVLRFVDDLSLVEVAAAMKRSVGAVKQLQHRATIALRRRMEDGA